MAQVPPFLWSDSGTFDSPKTYTVPGAGEVQPYTATATYTNASGQSILPALRIRSAEGALLALVFPAGQIADGATSEVTFVPPFGSAASDTQGIRYDTPNDGDWFMLSTEGGNPFNDDGILLTSNGGKNTELVSTGAIVLNSSGGVLLLLQDDSTNLLRIVSNGGTEITEQSGNAIDINANGGGEIHVNTFGGGTQIYSSEDGFIFDSTHTGAGLVGFSARLHTGDQFAVEDSDNSDAFFFTVSSFGTDVYLKTGGTFNVRDHNGNVILQVGEGGNSYRIKAGQAWVANL